MPLIFMVGAGGRGGLNYYTTGDIAKDQALQAGRVLEDIAGDCAFVFKAGIEKGRTGYAYPFSKQAVKTVRQLKLSGQSRDNYIKSQKMKLKGWRGRLTRSLRKFFIPPRNYFTTGPCKTTNDLFSNPQCAAGWTYEIYFNEPIENCASRVADWQATPDAVESLRGQLLGISVYASQRDALIKFLGKCLEPSEDPSTVPMGSHRFREELNEKIRQKMRA